MELGDGGEGCICVCKKRGVCLHALGCTESPGNSAGKSLSRPLAHDRIGMGTQCPDTSPRAPQSLQIPWAFPLTLHTELIDPLPATCFFLPFSRHCCSPTCSARSLRTIPTPPSTLKPAQSPDHTSTVPHMFPHHSPLPSPTLLRPDLCQHVPIL